MMEKNDPIAEKENKRTRKRINDQNARLIAVRILTRVEKEGAYANLLLRSQLSGLTLSRDRNLATALVNGALKNKLTLDYALRKHLNKPMSALPQEVRAVLRIGVFQILFMDRVPMPAAVNESVDLMNQLNRTYAPLVNSVLRKATEIGWNFEWPDQKKKIVRYLSVRYSHPEWMVKRWLTRWGKEETEALLKTNNEPALTSIRVNTLKTTREELKTLLGCKGIEATDGRYTPESLILKDFGNLEQLEEFQNGYFTVQDQSSQLAAHILGVRDGDRVLDVCSAPGGKTTHLAQLMKNKGVIIAVDMYPKKLELIKETAERLGISIIKTIEGDARILEGIEQKFDRVLVDAPCSGLGVLRKRADLRWQKREDEISELPELQLAILLKAADHVREGGELVYSTCTTEPEENFEVVKAFRQLKPEFVSVDLSESLPFAAEERDLKQLQKGVWQILPHHHNMDGFFIAKFRRPRRP
ncbi:MULTISPECIES: 16S rRNA (cytosine(967)-C(5))-methyltransferase RsmB [unclassified Dehalobacter]|uniref:16S rRNA (cytosine(967)-C(5))-methyltransferase RsmB n=1 Tax=unclassified Dehalobacter TaxID=2635733 RepID=UPI000E6D5564|nr:MULTISPECIES: 16S rRNA (cytosine(967)-C(5))-methyltransferase RsmB [unclassified Dehalobacter]RJE49231.1 16S rRNA (cytosine(967)-C(5))-methyltransferase [Dehalobacter sp. MCB1]TCX53276.1 16S rRNA (cytosine(967)-C(5))-methyltransferase RsmB [Dehalobacter sp. 14DCB1]TCX54290.1 16S rRNA (cytosine(967)-C(5))-methyltransferase RsmB [Dehalobacter sp. 12DCB1]